MKNVLVLLLSVMLTLVFAPAGNAMGESDQTHGGSVASTLNKSGFTKEEAAIIRTVFEELVLGEDGDYHERGKYRTGKGKHNSKTKGLPPGLAKRGGNLPPGLQKHIDETGALPPGLEKRRLPSGYRDRLPRRKDGTEIFWLDDDVYLIEQGTRAIIDVIRDVIKD